MEQIRILIVEDEMIIAARISLLLTNLGYEIAGILCRGEEAVGHVVENRVDIVLLDIDLKGRIDGIKAAAEMKAHSTVSVIYLFSNADEATFNRAKVTGPTAFISKPFRKSDLQRAIELTLCRMSEIRTNPPMHGNPNDYHYILSDRIFVKGKEKMVKIMLNEILYIEAERNYCRIFTSKKDYILCTTLKNIEEKLPAKMFVRIHRSYLINVNQIEEVEESFVLVGQKPIPMSAGLKDNLFQRLQTI